MVEARFIVVENSFSRGNALCHHVRGASEIYGKARLLLQMRLELENTFHGNQCSYQCTLGDGPVLILVPSTLTLQWQIEMMDKLGIPTAVWSSQKKVWLGVEGQILSPRGVSSSIRKCPYRIAIVSTGLIMHQREDGAFIKEAEMLLKNRYGTVILDEAHKARTRGDLVKSLQPNNLLAFMREIERKPGI